LEFLVLTFRPDCNREYPKITLSSQKRGQRHVTTLALTSLTMILSLG
jgi:hypothetical protein